MQVYNMLYGIKTCIKNLLFWIITTYTPILPNSFTGSCPPGKGIFVWRHYIEVKEHWGSRGLPQWVSSDCANYFAFIIPSGPGLRRPGNDWIMVELLLLTLPPSQIIISSLDFTPFFWYFCPPHPCCLTSVIASLLAPLPNIIASLLCWCIGTGCFNSIWMHIKIGLFCNCYKDITVVLFWWWRGQMSSHKICWQLGKKDKRLYWFNFQVFSEG